MQKSTRLLISFFLLLAIYMVSGYINPVYTLKTCSTTKVVKDCGQTIHTGLPDNSIWLIISLKVVFMIIISIITFNFVNCFPKTKGHTAFLFFIGFILAVLFLVGIPKQDSIDDHIRDGNYWIYTTSIGINQNILIGWTMVCALGLISSAAVYLIQNRGEEESQPPQS